MLILLGREEAQQPASGGTPGWRSGAPAGLLLLLSVASGGLGMAFVAGATVDALVRREFRRLWIPTAAVALAGIWAVAFDDDAASRMNPSEVVPLPAHVIELQLPSWQR